MSLNPAQVEILQAIRDEYKTANDDCRKVLLAKMVKKFIHADGKRMEEVSDDDKQEFLSVRIYAFHVYRILLTAMSSS